MLANTVSVAAQTRPEAPPPCRPSLGDLMTTTVQPHHMKLALAEREKSWVYAAYELHQFDEAFDRLSIMWPELAQESRSGSAIIFPQSKGKQTLIVAAQD
jgi:hypothetical protein